MKYRGVDWYPEQWGMALADSDLDDIKALGCDIVRIADFAWDRFEPQEGTYDFTFFDEVIQKVKEHGLKVLMCVPTATMPVWLYEKYPDIMNEDEMGYRQPFGARRGYCVNSEIYLSKAKQLAYQLALHYKGNPEIIGWQVDNEIGHEGSDMCYCHNCHDRFIEYLKPQFKNINELNERWGTSFWTHTYSSFKQIPLPKKAFTAPNPSAALQWERFRSYSNEMFIKELVASVKQGDPDAFVLHDFSGGIWGKHYNPFDIARHIDYVAYNNYPVWGGQKEPMEQWEIDFNLDTVYGLKKQNYMITESIMGAQGHTVIGCGPKPLQAKQWALNSIGHGCESLLFFRYRGFTKGAEQYCFGIVDSDNQKRRKYYETQSFFKEAADLMPPLRHSKVALIYDYDSEAAFRIQRQSDVMDYEKENQKLYHQFAKRDVDVDIVLESDDISGYEVVVIGAMIVMKESFKQKIRQFVANGGKVIMTFRCGWKDEDNNLIFGQRLPAGLTDLTGCMIEEQEALLSGQKAQCENGYGTVFEEMLTLTTAKSLVQWINCPFGDYSGATVNDYGSGKCYYLGSSFNEELLDQLFDQILG